MEIYCKRCDRSLGHYPDEKIPLNVKGRTVCKLCGEEIDIFRTADGQPTRKSSGGEAADGSKMLKLFRLLSIIEGTSLIALFCVAIPAKYYLKVFDVVWDVGMIHGILWSIYFIMSLLVSHMEKWKVTLWITVLFASVIPFACFFLERKLKGSSASAVA
ncbi:MAG: DUF3817 domain-containing protein [bacterium]|nr:DUF3817 domain-containing protein [bacterium]